MLNESSVVVVCDAIQLPRSYQKEEAVYTRYLRPPLEIAVDNSIVTNLPNRAQVRFASGRVSVFSYAESPTNLDIVNFTLDLIDTMTVGIRAVGFNFVFRDEAIELATRPNQIVSSLFNREKLERIATAQIESPLMRFSFDRDAARVQVQIESIPGDSEELISRFNFHYQMKSEEPDGYPTLEAVKGLRQWPDQLINDYDQANIYRTEIISSQNVGERNVA